MCDPNSKRNTFCGTLDYVAPEMVNGNQYDSKSDLWAIGVLTYELLVGKAPFETKSKFETLTNIKKVEVRYPNFLSKSARNFIERLLVYDPNERLSLEEAKKHGFIIKYQN